MPRDATPTRTAIMDAAETLILESGFAASSIDKVIDKAGVTKGGFFYHFKTKGDLALALVERYAANDAANLEAVTARAAQLSRDPLQQVIILVGLLREELAELTAPVPGCLFASYCCEAQLFDDATLEVARRSFIAWRERLGATLREAMALRPPRYRVDADSLADMLSVTVEGAFIMSKTLREPALVAAQLDHYRNYLELLFLPSDAESGGGSRNGGM